MIIIQLIFNSFPNPVLVPMNVLNKVKCKIARRFPAETSWSIHLVFSYTRLFVSYSTHLLYLDTSFNHSSLPHYFTERSFLSSPSIFRPQSLYGPRKQNSGKSSSSLNFLYPCCYDYSCETINDSVTRI